MTEHGSQDVDAYIADQPEALRPILHKLRETIRTAAPAAEERLSYRMPGYFHHGRLVWFAAFKRHVGFYPTASGVAAFEAELGDYEHATGTIRFPVDRPLPYDLVDRIVRHRVAENEAAALAKTAETAARRKAPSATKAASAAMAARATKAVGPRHPRRATKADD